MPSALHPIYGEASHAPWRIPFRYANFRKVEGAGEAFFIRRNMITQERLKELFSYDPETGKLTWGISKYNAYSGMVAGSIKKTGYVEIRIGDRFYNSARIIWIYYYGHIPEGEIDHINRNPRDNRIANLRLVDRSTNEWNKNIRIDNTSGLRGIFFHKKYGKWCGAIQKDSKRISTGQYICKRDAVIAYVQKFKEFLNPDSIMSTMIEPHIKWLQENENS